MQKLPWKICRRYREWETLHNKLCAVSVYSVPALPSKKLFGNMHPQFLNRRERELNNWLQHLLKQDIVTAALETKFLDPTSRAAVLMQWLEPTAEDREMVLDKLGGPVCVDDEEPEGPPLMQGELVFMQPGETSFRPHWFELRGLQLQWFDQGRAVALGEVRLDRAEVSTSPSLQESVLGGCAAYYFSISEAETTCILGAVDEETMRGWVCAILAQKGERRGGMAVLEGRFESSPERPGGEAGDAADRGGAAGGAGVDAGSLDAGGADPLGAHAPGDDPLGAAPADGVRAAPEQVVRLGGGSDSELTAYGDAVDMLSAYGGLGTQVQVLHAVRLSDRSLLFIGHHDTEFALISGEAFVANIKGAEAETNSEPEPEPEPESPPMFVSLGVPILNDLKYPQISETNVKVFSDTVLRAAPTGAQLGFKFISPGEANTFVARLQKVHTIVCELGEQRARAQSHRWLRELLEHSLRGGGVDHIEDLRSSLVTQQQTASSLLQSSSSFWNNVNEAELLDLDRRRRLTSSITAGANGAADVQIVASTTLGRGGSGLSGLPTRTELRENKAVAVYEINMVHKGFKWSVSRRYNDFVALRDVLTKTYPSSFDLKQMPFPGKGMGKSSTDPEVIFERSTRLLAWLTAVMQISEVCRATELLSFMGMKSKVKAAGQDEAMGSNYWRVAGTAATPAQQKAFEGASALASVDKLGRSIVQVMNDQSGSDFLAEQLMELCTFQSSLLALPFNVNFLSARGNRACRLWVVSDGMEIEDSKDAAISAPSDRLSAVQTVPYEDVVSANLLSTTGLLVKCHGRSSTPRNRHTDSPLQELQIECSAQADASRLIEEIDDRVQLMQHIAKKQRQVCVAEREVPGSGTVADSRRSNLAARLSEITGMTESQRVIAKVDKILVGERAQDMVEIAIPMREFVLKKFGKLPPATAAEQVREVLDSLQETLLDERASMLKPLLLEIPPMDLDDGTDSLPRIINRRLELAIVLPLRSRIVDSIRSELPAETIQLIETKKLLLRPKSQTFYGIDDAFVSPSNWERAVTQFDTIGSRELPSEAGLLIHSLRPYIVSGLSTSLCLER
jgi:hypothetical protein